MNDNSNLENMNAISNVENVNLSYNIENMSENPTVKGMRELISDYKRSYAKVTEHTESNDDKIQNVEDVTNSVRVQLDKLYMHLINHIESNGSIPSNTDDDTKLTYYAFGSYGITEGIHADPSLKEALLRYAKLDLRTYPYTLSPELIDAHKYKRTPGINNSVVSNRKVQTD